jgi:Tfp pilus assembly protein PilZ
MMTSKGPVVGETRNVSDRGAFICCREDVGPEARCRLFIMVPDRKPIIVPVEVCWSNPYGSEFDATPCGVGVRFRGISAADREAIAAVLTEELLEKAAD